MKFSTDGVILFCLEIKYKFEKLEYLREIQRLKSAISCYQESENFAGKDVRLIIYFASPSPTWMKKRSPTKPEGKRNLKFNNN